jgi:adenylate kinase
VSAGELIQTARREIGHTLSISKKVSDISLNQRLLLEAVERLRATESRMFLDGHYAVLNEVGDPEDVPVPVFERLAANLLVVLTVDPQVASHRLQARDNRVYEPDMLDRLQVREVERAQFLANALSVPLLSLDDTRDAGDAALRFLSSQGVV